jgi:cytochrome P450
MDPIAAATHADPYPYYAQLVANQPLYHDSALGAWVASSADAVTAVLTSDLCGIRPVGEPVPAAISESSAAEIFRHLVRMTDGDGHGPLKEAVSAALASVGRDQVVRQSNTSARILLAGQGQRLELDRSQDFIFGLPVHVLGSLLGIPQDRLQQTALWMSDFVHCLAPASSPEQIKQGNVAASHLRDMFRGLLVDQPNQPDDSLLGVLVRETQRVGYEAVDLLIANSIGFLWQGYEATAGLIGNTLLTLATHTEVRDDVAADPSLLTHVIQEVLRYDAPIQNTRRFINCDGILAGQKMKTGDAILVVLAAANRDPAANPNPERFDMFRRDRQIFSFGAGVHACPGDALATAIARTGIEELLATGATLMQSHENVTYRPSANARIPLLSSVTGSSLQ